MHLARMYSMPCGGSDCFKKTPNAHSGYKPSHNNGALTLAIKKDVKDGPQKHGETLLITAISQTHETNVHYDKHTHTNRQSRKRPDKQR